jgi:hypothetical protein
VLRRPEVQSNPQRLLQELKALDEVQHAGLRRFMVVWATTVAISVAGVLGGAGILGYAFIVGLSR